MKNMIKKAVILLLMAFFFSNASNQNMLTFAEADEKVTNITWKELQLLDYKKGIIPEKLQTLIGKEVSLAGYTVPLVPGSSFNKIVEFLLVSDPMACQHVAPPPPNQFVHVKMEPEADWESLFGIVQVTGKLKVVSAKSEYGKAAYELEGYKVGPFNGK